MLRRTVTCWVFLTALSVSASARFWNDSEHLRISGVGLLVFSAIGLEATGALLDYYCQGDTQTSNETYWRVWPLFLLSAVSGVILLIKASLLGQDTHALQNLPV